jgi:hypothetical protein
MSMPALCLKMTDTYCYYSCFHWCYCPLNIVVVAVEIAVEAGIGLVAAVVVAAAAAGIGVVAEQPVGGFDIVDAGVA